jgi:hypothetical protein
MNKKQTVIASVAKQSLAALATASLVFGLVACGSDSSSATDIECLEDENCLEEDSSDSQEESSSAKANSSSSSAKKNSSSSSVSSDSKTSSSSTGKDVSSSSVSTKESSSSVEESSSSSEEESSSSVELKITYLSETPNAVDLEVSGDTLFAVFQRYTLSDDGYTALFNDNGLLALYKLSDGTLLDTIPLVTKNPSAVKVVKGNVYVATHGEYNTTSWGTDADDNRGIEKVDLKNKKSELWVSGAALGGGAALFEVNAKTGKGYVAINKYYGSVPVVEVDLASKTVKNIDGVTDATGGFFMDASGKLYIGDRGFIDWNTYDMGNMNVRIYDGTELTSMFKDLDPDTYEGFKYQPAGISVVDADTFIYISDYTSGKLYWVVDNDGEKDVCDQDDAIAFSGDTKIVTVNGKLYVLDRSGKGSISNINTSEKTVNWQQPINAENPYDVVAIDDNSAWVAMFNTAEIRKISLGDGSTISSIDTKEFSAKKVEVVE